MKRRTKKLEFKEISQSDVENMAKRLGDKSAAKQALNQAEEYGGFCKFMISKTKSSYSILVIKE